jgi:hypothetical protein
MVSLAGTADFGGDFDGVVATAGLEALGADAFDVDAVGNSTWFPPLPHPATVRTSRSVKQGRLLMAHSYRIRSRHACDRIARP